MPSVNRQLSTSMEIAHKSGRDWLPADHIQLQQLSVPKEAGRAIECSVEVRRKGRTAEDSISTPFTVMPIAGEKQPAPSPFPLPL